MHKLAQLIILGASLCSARAVSGADAPWTTYEAEDMTTTGKVDGPRYDPYTVEAESSGRKCVWLEVAGQFVEFKARSAANAIVVRYSLPDSPNGTGLDSTLGLSLNGKPVRTIPVTSRYSYRYGRYPFTNDPKAGRTRHFFDEVAVRSLSIHPGDLLRLQKERDDAALPCVIDLVDLEAVPPPLPAPTNALCVMDFGADGTGAADDTEAFRKCVWTAKSQGKNVWVPAGVYKIAGDVVIPSNAYVQGAGMWHTTFVGDAAHYADPARRVRIIGLGDNIHLADFALFGKLNYRDDREANDGLAGSYGTNSTIARIWVEHTKTGAWINNSCGLVVSDCRFRNTIADGLNLCVGVRDSIVRNCAVRGTGDDCFAIWPATHAPQTYTPGHNVISHCTGQVPSLANGGAIYGGESNTIEDCSFTDISYGCGILISTTFPVADPAKKIDNRFSGTTCVQRCELVRCGGDDHEWDWRAALQICLDRHSLAGLNLNHLLIQESIYDGMGIIAPGSKPGGAGTLSRATLDHVDIAGYGLGVPQRHSLWVRDDVRGDLTIEHSQITGCLNSSTNFTINWRP